MIAFIVKVRTATSTFTYWAIATHVVDAQIEARDLHAGIDCHIFVTAHRGAYQ